MDELPESASVLPTAASEVPSRSRRFVALVKRLRGAILAIAAAGTVLGGLAGYWNGWRALRSAVSDSAALAPTANGTILPYSSADWRMTFAVLPFQFPTGDSDAASVALAAFEATQAEQESNALWARVAPRSLVEQTLTRPGRLSQVGQALDVHFLFRGSVTHVQSGYAIALAVIDAASERVLEHREIKVDPASSGKHLSLDSLREATHWLTYAALKQEVVRGRDKADAKLDVRDLTFRAYVDSRSDGIDEATAYATAMRSLERALSLAPNDALALKIAAKINLCECLSSWASDTSAMEAIGIAALDRFIAQQPDAEGMLALRVWMFIKRGQFEEALVLNERLLATSPADFSLLQQRVLALRLSGQNDVALALLPAMLQAGENYATNSTAAEVYFTYGNDAKAAFHARKALVVLPRSDWARPGEGKVALVLVAAESRAGHAEKAGQALKEFQGNVPKVRTARQIKGWLQPFWSPPGGEAFWEALQRAGVDE